MLGRAAVIVTQVKRVLVSVIFQLRVGMVVEYSNGLLRVNPSRFVTL